MGGGALRSARLGRRSVEAAGREAASYRLWDTDLKGFGLKVSAGGVKTYFVSYRAGSGRSATKREFSIGRHGTLTPDQARTEAERLLSEARLGGDPQDARVRQRRELTIAELCDSYVAEGCTTKKPSTLATDRARIERHIKPLLGSRKVSSVAREDLDRFIAAVAAGKTAAVEKTKSRGKAVVRGGTGTATKCASLLSTIFEFAISRKMRTDNPARGVRRFKERKVERFLSSAELERLGDALTALGHGMNPASIAIVRLLALSGARRGEIVNLRRSEIDWERGLLRLGDSKTGQKVVPLGAAALQVLRDIPEVKDSPLVFPSAGDLQRPFQGLPKAWATIRARAELRDVRLHDLRHSFASVGLASGQGLPLIGKLLGHADVATTARYAHLADDPVRVAADRISGAVAGAMAGRGAEAGKPSMTPSRGVAHE